MTSRVRRPGCSLALIATAVLLLGVAAMGVRWWVTSTLISELVSHHSSQPHPHRHPRRDSPANHNPVAPSPTRSPSAPA